MLLLLFVLIFNLITETARFAAFIVFILDALIQLTLHRRYLFIENPAKPFLIHSLPVVVLFVPVHSHMQIEKQAQKSLPCYLYSSLYKKNRLFNIS